MENLFLFQFCRLRCSYKKKRRAMLRALHSLKRGSCAGQFSTRALLSHTMTELSLLCIFVIRNSRSLRIPYIVCIFVRRAQLLSAYSQSQYVKGARELKIVRRKSLFSVNGGRLTRRVVFFITTSQTTKLKLKQILHIIIHF